MSDSGDLKVQIGRALLYSSQSPSKGDANSTLQMGKVITP